MFGSVHWQTEILTRPAATAATLAADDERENANLRLDFIPPKYFRDCRSGKNLGRLSNLLSIFQCDPQMLLARESFQQNC
jgi:hypothetical protein